MRNVLKFLVTFSVGFLIFGMVMERVGWGRAVEALGLLLSLKGIVLLILTFFITFVSISRWRLILKTQGNNFSLKDLWQLWVVGFTVSYLTPVALIGGEPLKIYLTGKNLSVPWPKSIASVLIENILEGTVFLVFLISGIMTFLFYGYFPSKVMAVSVFSVIGILIGLLFVFYLKALNKESILGWFLKLFGIEKKKIRDIKNGITILETEKEIIRFFSVYRNSFWKGLGLSFLRYLLLFLRVIILAIFLEEKVGIFKSLAIYGFTSLAFLFPLPAGLGSLEAASAFSFGVLGFSLAKGTVFGIVLRGVDLILCLGGLVLLVKFGVSLAGMKILEFIDKINFNK